jgi:hypothetical protein
LHCIIVVTQWNRPPRLTRHKAQYERSVGKRPAHFFYGYANTRQGANPPAKKGKRSPGRSLLAQSGPTFLKRAAQKRPYFPLVCSNLVRSFPPTEKSARIFSFAAPFFFERKDIGNALARFSLLH